MANILFRVDANSKIGWGHFYRCMSLAQMLKKNFNISFAMAEPPEEAIQMLKNEAFFFIELQKVEYTYTSNSNGFEVPFDLTNYLKDIDIVVLDGYAFGFPYQVALKSFPLKVAVIEDSGGGRYCADLIINPAPGLKPENYNIEGKSALFALGADYALLRPMFLKAAKQKAILNDRVESIFICFGGSDYNNLTCKTSLWFLENTDYRIQVVVGSSYQYMNELEALYINFDKRLTVKKELSEGEMLVEMKNADLGIVPSSGILYECIASRLPVISGYYVDNQLSIYNGWKTLNVFLDAGNLMNTKWDKVSSLITKEKLGACFNAQVSSLDGMSDKRFLKYFKTLVT